MKSSLLILLLLLLLSHLTPITRAESAYPLYRICQNLGNYTTNSTYQSNLNLLLHTLSSNGPTTGFLTDTEGSSPNQVFGLALCRGDTIQSNCASCLSNAVQDVVQLCPHQMSAIIWYDNCQLRYSNATFFSKVDSSLIIYMWNVKNISDPAPFFASLNGVLSSLTDQAANDTRMFATGELLVNGVTEMYVLVQCTRDLSPKSCEQCLQDAVGLIPTCCAGKMGGRVVGASCNLRYEKYLFYGNSTLTAKPVVGGGDGGSPAPSPSYKGGDPALAPSKTTMATKGSKKNAPRPILQIIIPVLILLIVTCITIAYFMKKKMVRNAQNQGDTHQITDTETIVFHLVTLRNATNDFSEENKLGEGGFGVVYKGTLHDGQEIAVKRLSKNSSQGLEELRNEVVLVAQLHHRNLVRLLGCCLEEEEKLLIYEFIPNTSLNNFLFNPTKGRELTWETRYKIIEGIARGLQYLHEDSQLKIIHRDLKASNILLDEKLIPKISDFGMARLFDMDQTQCNTNRVVGTYGYMAPEYAMYGLYSIKSDVFSFGVLCLEIITGRRNSHFCTSDDLLSHVWRYWTKGKVLEVVDPVLDDFSRNKVMQCIHIALLCVQEDAMIRPNMSSVVLMLSNYSTSVRVPSRPAFSFGDSEPNQPMLIESQPMISAEDFTELEPR